MSTRESEPGAAPQEPTEEELRAAYEAELARITTTDMMAQATVSLLNLGASRLAPPAAPDAHGAQGASAPDLEQARDAIDGAGALLAILERRIPRELSPLRDALSRLQMAYAGAASAAPASEHGTAGASGAGAGAGAGPGEAAGAAEDGGEQPGAPGEQRRPGPAESSGRLWVPDR